MHYPLDIRFRIASPVQQAGDLLQVGDGVQIVWALLSAIAAIQIAADTCIVCISRQLADVVDVVRDCLKAHDSV